MRGNDCNGREGGKGRENLRPGWCNVGYIRGKRGFRWDRFWMKRIGNPFDRWFQHGIRPTFSKIPRAVSRGKREILDGSRSRRREHKSDGGCVPWQITGPRFRSFARAYEWELKASRWERRRIGNNKYGHAARPYLFFPELSSRKPSNESSSSF